ncbi:heme exporter protein CcmD [Streptomyces albidoflavus]
MLGAAGATAAPAVAAPDQGRPAAVAPVRTAPEAPAAATVSEVAKAWRDGPVFVDPDVSDQLSDAQARDLSQEIQDSDKAIFVAVLPATFTDDVDQTMNDLRGDTGITGLYVLRIGDDLHVRADDSVLSQQATQNLESRFQDTTPADEQLTGLVNNATQNMGGRAPTSWSSQDSVSGSTWLGLGIAAVVVGGAAYTLTRRRKIRREQAQQEALAKLRVVVDEDITAFGEELERLDFSPYESGATDEMRGDYERALDAYENAKSLMDRARKPEDVREVTKALEDGRFALAVLDARRSGRELPVRRPPCFFDPRHGLSVADVTWAPPGGAPREVPVCAADQARLERGEAPDIRTVESDEGGRRPYWEAGPAYGPWAGGYWGGGLLPGLLVGTMLGHMMMSPAYAADYGSAEGFGDGGAGGGYEGGDVSGSDFDPGDFGGGGGGGFGDGGGFGGGGGDFGGGF